jgi:hypothetical protein
MAMVIALAGRRIDDTDAKETRFPLQNVESVRARLRATLKRLHASALVCSAACGADLIALSETGSLGFKRWVILPFERERFKQSSVIDRPGDWGVLYEKILDEIESAGNLIILREVSNNDSYSATNLTILDNAILLGHKFHEPVTAMLVWDGASRGSSDLTAGFGPEARKRGLPIVEVRTDE